MSGKLLTALLLLPDFFVLDFWLSPEVLNRGGDGGLNELLLRSAHILGIFSNLGLFSSVLLLS